MENYVTAQLSTLGWSVLLGLVCALVYDLLRTVRLRRGRAWLMHTLDAVYVAAALLAVVLMALQRGQGELRLYMLLGMALGAVMYVVLLRQVLQPAWQFWVDTMAAFIRFVWFPIHFLWKALKKACDTAKKLFHFWQKCATMTMYMWKCFLFAEKERGKGGGADREKKTAEEKPRRYRAAGGRAADRGRGL